MKAQEYLRIRKISDKYEYLFYRHMDDFNILDEE